MPGYTPYTLLTDDQDGHLHVFMRDDVDGSADDLRDLRDVPHPRSRLSSNLPAAGPCVPCLAEMSPIVRPERDNRGPDSTAAERRASAAVERHDLGRLGSCPGNPAGEAGRPSASQSGPTP